jgi:PAS domain S-box-containing protein
MSFLDVRTVMFSQLITCAVCTAVLGVLWVENRKRFEGISYWVVDLAFQTTSAVLVILRGSVPDWVSIGFSGPLVVVGALLGYMGLTRFIGRKSLQIQNYVVLAAFLAFDLYFVFIQPNIAARKIVISLALMVICFQCIWITLWRVKHRIRRTNLAVGLVFGAFCLVSLARIVVVLVSPPASNDLFRSRVYDALTLIAYDFLVLLLTFALALLINQRLLREVQIQEEIFTKAFRSSPYAITLVRLPDSQLMDVNDGFVTITGYSRAEAVGKTALELQLWVREADRAAVVSELAQGNLVVGKEYQFRKRSGQVLTGLFSAEIIIIGGLPWVLSSVCDITERKQAEAERERLTSAIEQVVEAVVVTDPEGKIQYVNPAFEMVTGYSREEALGQNPRILKSGEHDKAFYRELWRTISSGKSWKGTLVNKRNGGKLYTEDTTISPVCDAGGRIVSYVAVMHDITSQRLMEAQLQQAQKMETVGQLAGGVAHDFNNMLQVIAGYVEMSLGKVDAGQPLHKYLLEVRQAAQRSADITGHLLAFARRQTVSPKVLDLNEAVAGTQKMILRLIGEEIDLAWLPGHGLWRVKIDPVQLDQILTNLAVNARDAISGVGKLTLKTENVTFDEEYSATHMGFLRGEYVLLAVSDDGHGMTKETMSHLFEPFFTTKGPGKGTGLGLATVYGIIKQNNGFIHVYSEPGDGTTFKVYLPRTEETTAIERLERQAAAPRGGTETVLLVEDETAILELAKENLEQLGYAVLVARSPEEAIRRSEEHVEPIHLLITDVVMPQMDGRQLAERLSAVRPALKCLYMSGYTADVIAHRGVLKAGVSFIAKPFSLATLAEKVRAVLDKADDNKRAGYMPG